MEDLETDPPSRDSKEHLPYLTDAALSQRITRLRDKPDFSIADLDQLDRLLAEQYRRDYIDLVLVRSKERG